MHRLPLFVCVFLCICSCTKKSVQSIVLKANQDNIPISFVPIDSWLHDKRIIGAGEATHGTHEFATARLALFQYLVRQKGLKAVTGRQAEQALLAALEEMPHPIKAFEQGHEEEIERLLKKRAAEEQDEQKKEK